MMGSVNLSVARVPVLGVLLGIVMVAISGCGQAGQATSGEGWRWLATSADDSETFLRPITAEDELTEFWVGAAESRIPIDAEQPAIDFGEEFVLVMSTRGRGTEPGPCGVFFRGLRADREAREVTVVFERDEYDGDCDGVYVYGQYVIAVAWEFTGPPPFELLIDEPGQAGQPDPVQVTG